MEWILTTYRMPNEEDACEESGSVIVVDNEGVVSHEHYSNVNRFSAYAWMSFHDLLVPAMPGDWRPPQIDDLTEEEFTPCQVRFNDEDGWVEAWIAGVILGSTVGTLWSIVNGGMLPTDQVRVLA